MKVMDLLDEVQEKIENGGTVPFSNKVMIDPDELLDLLDEVRIQLPKELKDAIRIKEDEQRILQSADRRARSLQNEAERKMKELVDSDEITRNAYNQAEQILKNARQETVKMQVRTIDYSNSILKKVQDELRDIINTIEDNRGELREMRKVTGNNRSLEINQANRPKED